MYEPSPSTATKSSLPSLLEIACRHQPTGRRDGSHYGGAKCSVAIAGLEDDKLLGCRSHSIRTDSHEIQMACVAKVA